MLFRSVSQSRYKTNREKSISGKIGRREESIEAEPIKEGSGGEAEGNRVVQAPQEEVAVEPAKEEVKVEMEAQEPTEITTDDLEAKKADIEKRRQEEIEKIVANIFPNTKVKQILFRAAKKGLDKFSPSNETRGIYASGSKSEVDQYLARDRKNSKIYTIVMDIRNPKEYRKRYSFTDTRHTNLDEAIKEGKDGIIVTGRDGEINEEVAVVNSNQIHILSEKEISNIDTINAKYDAELSELENKKRHKSEVTADMKAQEPTEITTDDLEAKKADIPLGKVGNTEYEVKSDGVYFEGKKLNNPNNLSHKELITEDIRRRKKEELENSKIEIPRFYGFGELPEVIDSETGLPSSNRNDGGRYITRGDVENKKIHESLKSSLQEGDKLIENITNNIYYYRNGKVVKSNGKPLGFSDVPAFLYGVTIDRTDKINAKYNTELDALEKQTPSGIEETIHNEEAKKDDIEKRIQETNNEFEKFNQEIFEISTDEINEREKLIQKLLKKYNVTLPENIRIINWSAEELINGEWEAFDIKSNGGQETFFGKNNWENIVKAKKEFDIEFKKIKEPNLEKINTIEQKQRDLLSTADGLELRKAWSLGLIEEPNIIGLDSENFVEKETVFVEGKLVEKENYIGYYYLPNTKVDEDWTEEIKGKTKQEVIDKINAKYDTELTALEKYPSNVNAQKAEIERKRKKKLSNI